MKEEIINAGNANAEGDSVKAKLSESFIRPDPVVLGLELRPYGAGTALLLDQVRGALKTRLARLGGDDKWLADMSTYWFVAAFLWIHAAPLAEVRKAVWDADEAAANITDFVNRWQVDDLLGSADKVAAIINRSHEAGKYEVASSNPVGDNDSDPKS